MTTSFSVANINPGEVRREFMLSMMQLMAFNPASTHPSIRFDQFYSHECHGYLDLGRNECVEWYLDNTESDHLVFMDSDVIATAEQIYELVSLAAKKDLGLVGGVYFSASPEHGMFAVAYLMKHDDTVDLERPFPLPPEAIEGMAKINEVAVVDTFGTGFMCIRRDVLLAMQNKFNPPCRYFAEIVIDGVWMGEDHTFCLRAESLGFTPHVAPGIVASHIKPLIIRPEYLNKPKES
jgi:hypothetical protein